MKDLQVFLKLSAFIVAKEKPFQQILVPSNKCLLEDQLVLIFEESTLTTGKKHAWKTWRIILVDLRLYRIISH